MVSPVSKALSASMAENQDEQALAACRKIKSMSFTDSDISGAIVGLSSNNGAVSKACAAALRGVAPSKFKSRHILSMISQIKGDGSASDAMRADLLLDASMPLTVFTMGSGAFGKLSMDDFRRELSKHGLHIYNGNMSEGRQLAAIKGLKEGGALKLEMMGDMHSDGSFWSIYMVWAKENGRIRLSIDKRCDADLSQAFSPECTSALLDKLWAIAMQNMPDGFVSGQHRLDSHIAALGTALLEGLCEFGSGKPNRLANAQVDKMFYLLESGIDGSASPFFSALDKVQLTRSHYVSLISQIKKGYGEDVDWLLRDFAGKHQDDGLLSHDDIELFKEGMKDRGLADEYAKIYRHVGRHYAKLITPADLQIFIDNIDQTKPEYCSGDACGCKARAIADLANIVPRFFTDAQLNTVINTYLTSTTYRDGAAMILGYLAVNEPERFGEKCVQVLTDELQNRFEYDATFMLLNAAIEKPEIYWEKVRGIFMRGLGNEQSWPRCRWALGVLARTPPFSYTPGMDEALSKPLAAQKELGILVQYRQFQSYFDFDWLANVRGRIDELTGVVEKEKEAKAARQKE